MTFLNQLRWNPTALAEALEAKLAAEEEAQLALEEEAKVQAKREASLAKREEALIKKEAALTNKRVEMLAQQQLEDKKEVKTSKVETIDIEAILAARQELLKNVREELKMERDTNG